jgi:excisionase family DNA binding protein
MAEPLLVGVREAAQRLGIGRDLAYRLVRDGRLHAVRVTGRALIPVAELAAFVERESGDGFLREEVVDASDSHREGKGPVAVRRSGP